MDSSKNVYQINNNNSKNSNNFQNFLANNYTSKANNYFQKQNSTVSIVSYNKLDNVRKRRRGTTNGNLEFSNMPINFLTISPSNRHCSFMHRKFFRRWCAYAPIVC